MSASPQRTWLAIRRRTALLGVFAVLFQALLFGWHHHPIVQASHDVPSIASANPTAPLSPASAEDNCDICAALHHLSAAPGEFAWVPPPVVAAVAPAVPDFLLAAQSRERAFQARAPPLGT